MRFMMLVKATEDSEAGKMPSTELLTAMGQYNEQLVDAGVMLDGDGLAPSAKGARVEFSNGTPVVLDGPFAETKELISGFWLIQASSLDEAVEWARRVPVGPDAEFDLEIRPIVEAEDFGEEFTPAMREHEERMRAQTANRTQA
jgi:hypothetical protein